MIGGIYFTPGDSGLELCLYDAAALAPAIMVEEVNWGGVDGSPILVDTPDRFAQVDEGVIYSPRKYTLTYHLSGAYQEEIERLWGWWHLPERGVGTLRRITADGVQRVLLARPTDTKWGKRSGGRQVTQVYTAADPWWRDADETTASGSFNDDTPVAISFANAGQIPTRPRFVITGIVHTPKLVNAAGETIELNKATANADDVLVISCRRGDQKATYYEYGAGAGVSWYAWRSNATKFWDLPVGASNVTISGAASETSTATCQVRAYLRYGSR